MKKILTSILVIASMSFLPATGAAAAAASQPAVTAKCAAATDKVKLALGKVDAAIAKYRVAKDARDLAVKQKNPKGIATAEAQMKRITLEISVLSRLHNSAVAAAKIACK
jgi:hypothetical protein